MTDILFQHHKSQHCYFLTLQDSHTMCQRVYDVISFAAQSWVERIAVTRDVSWWAGVVCVASVDTDAHEYGSPALRHNLAAGRQAEWA